jgi:hypothetical protein
LCEMCTVVNFKQYGSVGALDRAPGPRWLYIGRLNPRAGLARSPLANPFKVKDFGGQLLRLLCAGPPGWVCRPLSALPLP